MHFFKILFSIISAIFILSILLIFSVSDPIICLFETQEVEKREPENLAPGTSWEPSTLLHIFLICVAHADFILEMTR